MSEAISLLDELLVVSSTIVGKTSKWVTVSVGSGRIVGKISKSVRVVGLAVLSGGSGSGTIVGKTSRSVTVSVLLGLAVVLVELLLKPSPHRRQVRVIAPDSRTIMPKGMGLAVVVGLVVVLLADELDGTSENELKVVAVSEFDQVVEDDCVVFWTWMHVAGKMSDVIAARRVNWAN